MDPTHWHERLIGLFCYLSERYHDELWVHVARLSPNHSPEFTDEEVLTIYIFGLWQHLRSLAAIHRYTRAHLSPWFPKLPSYPGFVQRLNRLEPLLPALSAPLLVAAPRDGTTYVVDSLPIRLAQQVRSGRARVACEWADKGYCASQKQYYYGVKLHLLGQSRAGTMPRPTWGVVSRASENDLTVLKRSASALPSGELYADKIYQDQSWQRALERQQHLVLRTPIKRKPGQTSLDAADRLYSRAVSRVRQPIESLFHWIDEQTGIQNASRVRSPAGLWVHVFGRLAAAVLLLTFNP